MATPITKKRRQVVLVRDADGNVIYDKKTGRPLIEKTIRKSRRDKRSSAEPAPPENGPVTTRQMTAEEREHYAKVRHRRCALPPVRKP